jgi:hypothetical protein
MCNGLYTTRLWLMSPLEPDVASLPHTGNSRWHRLVDVVLSRHIIDSGVF